MNDIMKAVKSLEESCLLIKGVSETIQTEVEEQKGELLSMLFGKLGASLLGNFIAGRGVQRSNSSNIPGRGSMRAGYGAI